MTSAATGDSPTAESTWNHVASAETAPAARRKSRPVFMKISTSGRSSRPTMVATDGGFSGWSGSTSPKRPGTGKTYLVPTRL